MTDSRLKVDQSGSHQKWRHPRTQKQTIVAYHLVILAKAGHLSDSPRRESRKTLDADQVRHDRYGFLCDFTNDLITKRLLEGADLTVEDFRRIRKKV